MIVYFVLIDTTALSRQGAPVQDPGSAAMVCSKGGVVALRLCYETHHNHLNLRQDGSVPHHETKYYHRRDYRSVDPSKAEEETNDASWLIYQYSKRHSRILKKLCRFPVGYNCVSPMVHDSPVKTVRPRCGGLKLMRTLMAHICVADCPLLTAKVAGRLGFFLCSSLELPSKQERGTACAESAQNHLPYPIVTCIALWDDWA